MVRPPLKVFAPLKVVMPAPELLMVTDFAPFTPLEMMPLRFRLPLVTLLTLRLLSRAAGALMVAALNPGVLLSCAADAPLSKVSEPDESASV